MLLKNKITKSGRQELSDWIFEHHRLHYRYGFLAYLLTYTSFLFLDKAYYPRSFGLCLAVRLLIGVPLLAIPVIMSFTKYYKKYFLILNSISAGLIPITFLFLTFYITGADYSLNTVYFSGLIIQILIIGLFVYSWRITFIISILIVAISLFGGVLLFQFNEKAFFYEEQLLLFTAAAITTIISFFYLEIKVKIIKSEKSLLEEKKLLEDKNAELIISNKQKNKLFSIIAHDLKSPFSAFLGLSKVLADETDSLSKDEINRFSILINKSASNLYRLIDNLLKWSLLQSGKHEFIPELYSISEIIKSNIEIMAEQANQKEIAIHTDLTEAAVTVDINMISAAIRNLISNAIKFSYRNSGIYIDVKPDTDNRNVVVRIRDTGIGIEPDCIDKIFDIDKQTPTPGTEGEPSTGLGLALCREFVEKHGGRIWAESQSGKGSAFYFTIPLDNKV